MIEWSVILERPDSPDLLLFKLGSECIAGVFEYTGDGFDIGFSLTSLDYGYFFEVTVSSPEFTTSCFISLQASYRGMIPYSFNGEVAATEVFRQSPHDIDAWLPKGISLQAVPLVALMGENCITGAFSNSPAFYDNSTSQSFYPGERYVKLSSGDRGLPPGYEEMDLQKPIQAYNGAKGQRFSPGKIEKRYHVVSPGNNHVFSGVIFSVQGTGLSFLREETNLMIAASFSRKKYSGIFGALSFSTSYMNLRTNETGNSRYWVVPSVEYANTQYCRDAFWIATMFDDYYDSQCLMHELCTVNSYAEYALYIPLWAFRSRGKNTEAGMEKLQAYVSLIESRVQDGWYQSYDENDGRHDFQYWADQIAFEPYDSTAYNQGLLALALASARALGLSTDTDPEEAARNYRSLFDSRRGWIGTSRYKNHILGPDPLVPDLLSTVWFGIPLLPSDVVIAHCESLERIALTPFGYKIFCTGDGSYLSAEDYDIPGYVSQANRGGYMDGDYLKGGSWFLYDCLALLTGAVHGFPGALECLLRRIKLDFTAGGTTFEYIDTKQGAFHKPNMGWNIAVYALTTKLVRDGKIATEFLTSIEMAI